MGKAFLYGRTLEKDIADRYAKLTVYSPIDGTVLVRSVDSSAAFEAKTNITDGVVFNRISPGYWDVTLADVENVPVKRIKIDDIDREITLGDIVATVDITYPVGSVCTIINGDNVYTAPDTSGKWTCTVYDVCELIVSCVDGDLNTSSVINVTNNGETVHVTLKYFAAIVGITYPSGSTCTISDGIRTYTAPDTSGIWECTVNYPGMWTVFCSDGEHTESESVSIVSDGQNISVTIKYFEATINITYTEGSTCTCSYGGTTYTAPDTSGNWTCKVTSSGEWVVTITDGLHKASKNIIVTSDGEIVNIRLNYEVIVYATEDAMLFDTPNNSTIGIVTSIDVVDWLCDSVEPTKPYEGLVWIVVDGSLKPISAKQYINGTWAVVTAKTYRDGEWVDWIEYLFSYGSQSYAWQCRALRYYTSTSHHGGVTPSCVTNSDGSVTISMTNDGSVMCTGGCYELVQDYDLTHRNKLIIEYASATTGTYLSVNTRSDPQWSNHIAVVPLTPSISTKTELDVSWVTEAYDIMVYLYRNSSSTGKGTEIITIKQIYVE